MPHALEAVEQIVRHLECAGISALEAINILRFEEVMLSANTRMRTSLGVGRLATIKTLEKPGLSAA